MTHMAPVKRMVAGVLLGLLLGLTTAGPLIAQVATPPPSAAAGENVDQDMREMMEQCTAMMRVMMGMMGDHGMAGMSGMMGGTETPATPTP